MNEIKKKLRAELLESRSSIPEENRIRKNAIILEKLKSLPEWKQTEVIFTYVSFGNEVDTIDLIKECFKAGKKVAVPKVIDKINMEFYYILSLEELYTGVFGILEPKANDGQKAEVSNIQIRPLMVMPGLGFDKEGHRIGYGGGFYDRYLERHGAENFVKVCLAYEEQIRDIVVSENHDIIADMIISDFP